MSIFFLALYILAVIIRPHEFFGFLEGVPLPFILELLTVVMFTMGKKRFDAVQIKAVLWLNLCIAISWLTLSMTVGISMSIQFFANQALMLILIANIVNTSSRHRLVLGLMVFGAAVMSVHGYYQVTAEDKMGWTGVKAMVRYDSGSEPIWQARYTGPFKDPNDMGMLLACSLPLVLYLWKTSKGLPFKFIWLIQAAAIFYGIYLVNSRGTMLAAIAPLLLYFAYKYNFTKMLVPIAIIVPMIMLVLPSRMLISNEESAPGRIEAWYQGYLMLKSNPLFGVGMHNFVDHHFRTAHNSWVLAYAELGFIGFFFWMLIIVSSLHMLYHYTRISVYEEEGIDSARGKGSLKDEVNLASATFYALVSVLVAAFFLSRTYSFLLYLLCGLAVSSYYRMHIVRPEVKIDDIKLFVFFLSMVSIVVIALLVMFKS
jgi:hypothetical protein